MTMLRILYTVAMTAAVVTAETDERQLQTGGNPFGFFTSLFGGLGGGDGEGQEELPHPQGPPPTILLPEGLDPEVQQTKPQTEQSNSNLSPPIQVPSNPSPPVLLPTDLYSIIVSRDYSARSFEQPVNACIQVQELTEGQTMADDPKLILGNCDDYFTTGVVSGGWRLDENDLFRSQLDDRYCMQAGNGNEPKEGNLLRVGLCDATLDSQKFVYFPNIGIRPAADQTLCVVWKGQDAQVGDDPILLNRCQWVRDRRQWDFGTV